MKFLRNILDKQKAGLEKNEKLKKFWPLIDALDTFVFTPNHVTHKGAHVRDGIDLKRTMMMVILALVPCLLFGMFNVGHQYYLATGKVAIADPVMSLFSEKFGYGAIRVLPLVIVSYASGLLVEFIFAIKNGHAVQEGFLVSGLLIPLVMPVGVPLWMVAVGTMFAVLIGKEVFGGTGMNILNVALTARAFLFFSYPTKMSGNEVWIDGKESFVDGFSGATALGDLASFTQETSVFSSIVEFTERYPLYDSFIGIIPGSIGETSGVACLIGALLLLGTGIASWRVMISFFLGGLAMSALFNLADANEFMKLEPLHQLSLGGFFFGMVFMVTDPVTAAQTNTGKWIYGALAGLLAILIRVVNPAYPEGVMLAILFGNVMAPLIDHYVIQANVKRRLKRVKTA